MRRADLLEAGEDGEVGNLWRYSWRSRLPYDLTFDARVTRVERPYLLEARVEGELAGVDERPGADRAPAVRVEP
jgi:hypothetical protein